MLDRIVASIFWSVIFVAFGGHFFGALVFIIGLVIYVTFTHFVAPPYGDWAPIWLMTSSIGISFLFICTWAFFSSLSTWNYDDSLVMDSDEE